MSDARAGNNVSVGTLQRLTNSQYDNAIRDLLGDSTQPAAALLTDERVGPFSANPLAPVSDGVVQNYETLADGVAARAMADFNTVVQCDPNMMTASAAYESTCVSNFVTSFGKRAFRRPLTGDEVQTFNAVYKAVRASNTVNDSMAMVLSSFLQNPFFLYRLELGTPSAKTAAGTPLTDYEMASRLAFFLWDTLPDDALLAAAGAGSLHDPVGIGAQIQRMLDDPKAASTLHRFHQEWLGVDVLPTISKSAILYPNYTPAMAASMQAETDALVASVFADPNGSFDDLLGAPYAFVDANLAPLYGLPTPSNANGVQRTSFDPNALQRRGVLGEPGFLAAHAHEDQTDIVHRGIFVRTVLFCQDIPSPPNNVVISVPVVDANSTSRQRQIQHTTNATCAACHTQMDPLGFGMEMFDAVGAYRTTDGGLPIDASGTLTGTDVNGPYNGLLELSEHLLASAEVHHCYTVQWFRFALGRMETAQDSNSIEAVNNAFVASHGNIRALLVALGTSDSMRYLQSN